MRRAPFAFDYSRGNLQALAAPRSQAAFAAVSNGRRLDSDLSDIYAGWEHAISARGDAAVWRVLPLLVGRPAVTIRFIQSSTGVSQPTAQNAVDQLVTAGVLAQTSDNRRNRVWLANEVIAALDGFAARTGRRG